MQNVSNNFKAAIDAPVRKIGAKAELYLDSALIATYTKNDSIISIDIERVGEDSKFFGFGVSHKYNIKLIDINRIINLSTENYFKISLGVEVNGSIEYVSYPKAYITEVNRDENTNELSITAYDSLDKHKSLTFNDLGLTESYSIRNVLNAIAGLLGASSVIVPENNDLFDLAYESGANFEGIETLNEILKAAAEATGTIYFINGNDALVFKRLDKDGTAAKVITKEQYIALDSKTNRRLQTIASVTELGDNVSASTTAIGSTQYLRDNPFLELRDDVGAILSALIEDLGDISINQFECEWRGDMALEIGDKIALTTKDNNSAISYVLNDSISYSGALEETTEWNYTDTEETEANPSTLGAALKQTYAKVDKAAKEVEIVASQTEEMNSAISTLQINTESINTSIQSVEQATTEGLESLNNDINTLTNKINSTMTSEEIEIKIQSEMNNGVSKVKTETGFTLDNEGLHISKEGSEMTTTLDEDGMLIEKDNEEVLRADHEGVKAYDLHAKTYLIIGETSRFEDYEKDGGTRTGCFWIGGEE